MTIVTRPFQRVFDGQGGLTTFTVIAEKTNLAIIRENDAHEPILTIPGPTSIYYYTNGI